MLQGHEATPHEVKVSAMRQSLMMHHGSGSCLRHHAECPCSMPRWLAQPAGCLHGFSASWPCLTRHPADDSLNPPRRIEVPPRHLEHPFGSDRIDLSLELAELGEAPERPGVEDVAEYRRRALLPD